MIGSQYRGKYHSDVSRKFWRFAGWKNYVLFLRLERWVFHWFFAWFHIICHHVCTKIGPFHSFQHHLITFTFIHFQTHMVGSTENLNKNKEINFQIWCFAGRYHFNHHEILFLSRIESNRKETGEVCPASSFTVLTGWQQNPFKIVL